jgi:hypothetical protein
MLVAICTAYGPGSDLPFDARAVYPASKSQHSVSLRAEEYVLLVNSSFQLPLLAWTLVMTGDNATLLHELHGLGALSAIRPFRVNGPIASDVGWRFLGDRDIASNEQHESEAKQTQLRFVVSHGVLQSRHSLHNWAGL